MTKDKQKLSPVPVSVVDKIKKLEMSKIPDIPITKIIKETKLNIELNNEDEYSGVNKWGEEYTKTVITWQNECNEMGFVYDEAAHDRKDTLIKFLIVLFVINAISTVVSPLPFSIDDTQYHELNLALRIFTSLMTLTTTILLGIMKYFAWDETIEKYQNFVLRIDNFLSNLTSELSLPRRLRKDAEEFIRQNKDMFSEIIKNSPDIHPQEYRTILAERYESEENKLTNLRAIKQQKINNAPISSLTRQLES